MLANNFQLIEWIARLLRNLTSRVRRLLASLPMMHILPHKVTKLYLKNTAYLMLRIIYLSYYKNCPGSQDNRNTSLYSESQAEANTEIPRGSDQK